MPLGAAGAQRFDLVVSAMMTIYADKLNWRPDMAYHLPGGHMFYLGAASRAALRADAKTVFDVAATEEAPR